MHTHQGVHDAQPLLPGSMDSLDSQDRGPQTPLGTSILRTPRVSTTRNQNELPQSKNVVCIIVNFKPLRVSWGMEPYESKDTRQPNVGLLGAPYFRERKLSGALPHFLGSIGMRMYLPFSWDEAEGA